MAVKTELRFGVVWGVVVCVQLLTLYPSTTISQPASPEIPDHEWEKMTEGEREMYASHVHPVEGEVPVDTRRPDRMADPRLGPYPPGHDGEERDFDVEHDFHFLQFGEHRPSLGGVRHLRSWPLPRHFAKFTGTPFLIEQGASIHKAKELWTDEYLNDHYPYLRTDIEKTIHETVNDHHKQIAIDAFLASYKDEGIYARWILQSELKKYLTLPLPLRCGGSQHLLSEAHIWFSSGHTSSMFHKDHVENFHCVFDGEKEFILVDKEDKEIIEAPGQGWLVNESRSSAWMEGINPSKYRSLVTVEHYNQRVKAGDCIYVPAGWYHQVRSDVNRSLSVGIYFEENGKFDEGDCQNTPAQNGNNAAWNLDAMLLSDDKSDERPVLKFPVDMPAELRSAATDNSLTYGALVKLLKNEHKWTRQVFDTLDSSHDGVVDIMEMETATEEALRQLSRIFYVDQHIEHSKAHLQSHHNPASKDEL